MWDFFVTTAEWVLWVGHSAITINEGYKKFSVKIQPFGMEILGCVVRELCSSCCDFFDTTHSIQLCVHIFHHLEKPPLNLNKFLLHGHTNDIISGIGVVRNKLSNPMH